MEHIYYHSGCSAVTHESRGEQIAEIMLQPIASTVIRMLPAKQINTCMLYRIKQKYNVNTQDQSLYIIYINRGDFVYTNSGTR